MTAAVGVAHALVDLGRLGRAVRQVDHENAGGALGPAGRLDRGQQRLACAHALGIWIDVPDDLVGHTSRAVEEKWDHEEPNHPDHAAVELRNQHHVVGRQCFRQAAHRVLVEFRVAAISRRRVEVATHPHDVVDVVLGGLPDFHAYLVEKKAIAISRPSVGPVPNAANG
nr:hypothetical protein [Luteimonas cellulosilyticus]